MIKTQNLLKNSYFTLENLSYLLSIYSIRKQALHFDLFLFIR